jgi:hypothetical protein
LPHDASRNTAQSIRTPHKTAPTRAHFALKQA